MLIIKKEFRDEIIKHARLASPSEVCGILSGGGGKADKIYKMKNTSDKPEICYFMDPKEQLQVMKEIRSSGKEMVGIYHSHTESEAYPSARDLELAFYPDAYYIIISLKDNKNPSIRAFRIVEGKISEEEIITK